jgi:hypothetical protein
VHLEVAYGVTAIENEVCRGKCEDRHFIAIRTGWCDVALQNVGNLKCFSSWIKAFLTYALCTVCSKTVIPRGLYTVCSSSSSSSSSSMD